MKNVSAMPTSITRSCSKNSGMINICELTV